MSFDAVIIGAGPAGSSCAFHLAVRGHRVLLVEQHAMPRHKPCGDGLTPRAMRALASMGLETIVRRCFPIYGIRFVDTNTLACADVDLSADAGRARAGVLRRFELDMLLCEAARTEGAELWTETQALEITESREGRATIVLQRANRIETVSARFAVIAEGSAGRLGSQVRRRTSGRADFAFAMRQYFDVSERPTPMYEVYAPLTLDGRPVPGYGWVFPVDDHAVNVGVGIMPGHTRISLRDVFDKFVPALARRGDLGDMRPTSSPLGAPLRIGLQPTETVSPLVLAIGDSAGLVNPFTGEGIAYALESGSLAAEAIAEELAGSGQASVIYTERLDDQFRRHVRLRPFLPDIYTLFGTHGHAIWKSVATNESVVGRLARLLSDRRNPKRDMLRSTLLGALTEDAAAREDQSRAERALISELEAISPLFSEAISYTRDESFLLPGYRATTILAAARVLNIEHERACFLALVANMAELVVRLYADVRAPRIAVDEMLALLGADALLLRLFQLANGTSRETAIAVSVAVGRHIDEWTTRYVLGVETANFLTVDDDPQGDPLTMSLLETLSPGVEERERFTDVIRCASRLAAAAEIVHDLWLDYECDRDVSVPVARLRDRGLAGSHVRAARRGGGSGVAEAVAAADRLTQGAMALARRLSDSNGDNSTLLRLAEAAHMALQGLAFAVRQTNV